MRLARNTIPNKSMNPAMNLLAIAASLFKAAWAIFVAIDRNDYVFYVSVFTCLCISSWVHDILR